MSKVDKLSVGLLILLVLSGGVSWSLFFREYQQKDTFDIHAFPMKIGHWKATELPISDEDYAILETRNAFSRIYRNDQREEVMLFIVYSQDNRKVSHPPEICYTGGGATILSSRSVSLEPQGRAPFKANKILLEQRGKEQMMYYWFKVGGWFTSNYWKQQLLFSLQNLTGSSSSSALIRVTSRLDAGDKWGQATSQKAESFIAEAVPFFFEYLP